MVESLQSAQVAPLAEAIQRSARWRDERHMSDPATLCAGLDSSRQCTVTELKEQLEAFRHYYNHIRPHRALGRRTPLQAYSGRTNARPVGTPSDTYFRVREDKVDKAGKVFDVLTNHTMRARGLEPPRGCPHRLLRPACLPVPPRPRADAA